LDLKSQQEGRQKFKSLKEYFRDMDSDTGDANHTPSKRSVWNSVKQQLFGALTLTPVNKLIATY